VTRIGLVVHGQPPELVGGTERLVAELGAALSAAGETVEIFSGSIEWRPAFEVVRDEQGPVPVVRAHRHDLFFERWDKLHNPFVEGAFSSWLDEFRPDFVHLHHWARLSTALVACCHSRGVPVAVSLHDLFPSCPRYHRVREDLSFCTVPASPQACRGCAPRWRFQGDAEIDASVTAFARDMREELAAADELLVPTAGHGERLLDWMGLKRAVTVVPPASSVALAPATRPLERRVAGTGDPLRVGTFGHLHPLKGVEVLLDALSRLPPEVPVEAHVWGEAPTPEMAEALRQRASARPVVWYGRYRPEDLSQAPIDVVVLPTLCAESYSFALDEACALGVPVLATELGALVDRATGRVRLFPRGDAHALAADLRRLATDPAERDRMATAPAPPRLDVAAHLEALAPVYERLRSARRESVQGPSDAGQRQRREHAFELREAGLRELLRSEGWEDVVTRLQAEIDDLRRRSSG
jgi:glycosyltransferase involved in cell wall biosynthesis